MVMSLLLILISCELFTNGIEWLGKELKVGDGVVGSIFSAIGTCLPETMVPVIAILFFKNNTESIDIAIGAITGAPFMLSTLAFFVTGASVLIFSNKRRTGMRMNANKNILRRDISFFIIAYSFGISSSFLKAQYFKRIVAIALILIYIFYITLTVKHDKRINRNLDKLYLSRVFNIKPNLYTVMLQVNLALSGVVFGAHLFVIRLDKVSKLLDVPVLILSLVVTPIATELPEKFNSVIWVSKKKDTLALGNITGAMVFQSCIPVSIGIMATPWILSQNIIVSAVLSVLSASIVYFWIEDREVLSPIPLIAGGVFYLMFVMSL